VDKWFKVLSKDLKAKDGGSFDYVPFVDGKNWTPVIKDKKICSTGYHVTRYWNMFVNDSTNRIFEVEVKDLIEEEVLAGVCEKAVCSSLKIVKEFVPVYKNDLNTGYRNTGYSNTGDSNTGDWNTGSYHAGAFNVKDAEKVYLFDKEILKTDYDKIVFPQYFYFELEKNYKKSWKNSFATASQSEIQNTIKLPNFDYKIFQSITGISKKMIEARL